MVLVTTSTIITTAEITATITSIIITATITSIIITTIHGLTNHHTSKQTST
jgi:hypothetical protein